MFGFADGILYGLIRHLKPKRIIEAEPAIHHA
jgi:hypothetical protein